MKIDIFKESEKYYERMCMHTDFLQRNAEAGFELMKTKAYVKDALEAMGLTVREYGKCGLGACINGEKSGKTILLRADMDALPGIDSQNPSRIIHACGHHLHTAMLLGAAEILCKNREFDGCVKLMFQGAEEILEGAADMIEGGILKEPKPDGAIMVHVITAVDIPVGNVIVSSGGVSAPAADFFRIIIRGGGAHGALSHQGIDAISAAAHLVTALDEIKAKEVAINEAMGLSVGSIKGGKAPNALPEEVVIEGTLRSFDEELQQRLKGRLCDISENITAAFRAKAEVQFLGGCPPLKNDESLSFRTGEVLKDTLGEKWVKMSSQMRGGMSGGSEDFAYVSRLVPSVMIAVAAGDKKEGYKLPLHNPNVCFDKRALKIGAAVYAASALGFLS